MNKEILSGRHVAVTGGTGALGQAVVARLIGEGAICHVPIHRAKGRSDEQGGAAIVAALSGCGDVCAPWRQNRNYSAAGSQYCTTAR